MCIRDRNSCGALQEADIDDVRLILREPADAKCGGTALAVAKQDTEPTAVAVAYEVADQDTAEAVALRREAVKWVTKSKDDRFVVNLVDNLPTAVADEQVRLYKASKCESVVPHALGQWWCIHKIGSRGKKLHLSLIHISEPTRPY